MSFSYCLNSSTIKPTPILEKIAIAGATGYAAIELWHDDIDLLIESGGSLDDVKNALVDQNLEVPTTIYLHHWFDSTGDEHTKALDECKRRMEQSVAVGAEFAIAGPPPGMTDLDVGAQNYRELLEIGISMGVKPSMEFLGFVDHVNTIEHAIEIMEKCGHDAATTILDPFHVFRGGGSIESIAKLRPEQIAISHFNDAPAQPPREVQHDPDRVMPGDGHLDLKRYVDLLSQIGYDGYLSLELFREDLWEQDPMEVARIGLDKMRSVVEG